MARRPDEFTKEIADMRVRPPEDSAEALEPVEALLRATRPGSGAES